jgi:hypothetical protein
LESVESEIENTTGVEITPEKVSDIEKEMNISIHDALVSGESPNILDAVMAKVNRIGIPQPHLRLVSSEESLIEVQDDTEETSNGVHVEIQEIRSPLEIDGDSTIARLVAYGVSSLFAVAAVAFFWMYLDLDRVPQEQEGQITTTQNRAEVEEVNLVEIESIDSEAQVSYITSDEGNATIILIDDFEGE